MECNPAKQPKISIAMPSTEQLLYINALLFCVIAVSGIFLVVRARKSMAGEDGRYVMLTTAGRLSPAVGCIAALFSFLQSDPVRGVAVLATFSFIGVSLSFIGQRFSGSGR